MKTLGLLLLGAVAIGAIYFWNPTICSTLNQIPGLDKFDLCNLGHGGVVNQQDTHDRLSTIHHQAALQHHNNPHPHHMMTPSSPPSSSHSAPTPAFHPTSNSIGTPVGAGVALGLGNAAFNDAHASFAEMSHHRMSI